MSKTLAIAAREIAERRAVLIAAAVGGLLPFASPLLPGVGPGRVAEARDAMALGVALAFGGATALAMGATVVARDLSEKRMTFDFARPLSWRAIWGGRFLGAIALTLFVTAIVLLPAAVVSPLFSSLDGTNVPGFLLAVAGMLVALIPIAHAASIAIRSRSRWLAVDLVCGVVVVLAVAWSARQMLGSLAMRTFEYAAAVLVPLAVLSLWAASAAQVASGRTDLKRGHGALSRTVWSCLLTLAAVLVGYTTWLLAPSPRDLTEAWGSPAPRGSWAVIAGHSKGRGDYMAAMLFDTATGHFERLGPAVRMDARFSADGKRAIFLRPLTAWRAEGLLQSGYEIVVAELGPSGATMRETTLSLNGSWPVIGVSDDGHQVAVIDDANLSVYEVDTGRTRATTRLPEAPSARRRRFLFFAGADRVRLLSLEPQLVMEELDLTTKSFAKTSATEIALEMPSLQALSGDRIFAHEVRSSERAYVLDARTCAVLQAYTAPGGGKAKFRRLSDGRVIAIDAPGTGRAIHVLAEDGHELRSVALEDTGWVVTGGELAPGKLVLSAAAKPGEESELDRWRTLLLDADSGELRETARGLIPWVSDRFSFSTLELAPPGEAATRLFGTSKGLVYHDPLTGETRPLTGRGARGSS